MKVAVLTAAFPHPLDEGRRIRSFKLIEQLSAIADVHLFALCNTPPTAEQSACLRSVCKEISLFPHRRGVARKVKDVLRSSSSALPYLAAANTNAELRNALRNELAKGAIDIIQVEELCMCENLPTNAGGAKLVLDAQNVEAVVQLRIRALARNPLAQLFYSQQARLTAIYEQRMARRMDAVLCVSREDQAHFAALNPRTVLVPNGVDRVEPAEGKRAPTVVFTGTMQYAPNRDAVEWFLEAIWPNIRREEPNAAFQVIARHPPEGLVRRYSDDAAFLTDVEDIQPYLAAAQVMIVPLRAGGGTRLKILQAFASGLPVVSTTVGAEGLAATDGRDLLLGDSESQLAEAVVSLLRSPSQRESVARRAQDLVASNYLWPEIFKPCAAAYRELLR